MKKTLFLTTLSIVIFCATFFSFSALPLINRTLGAATDITTGALETAGAATDTALDVINPTTYNNTYPTPPEYYQPTQDALGDYSTNADTYTY